MSRTLSEIALANEIPFLLERLKVRRKYLPRKVESQNQADARAKAFFKNHDLPKDLPPDPDESPESTKPNKKTKKKTAAKKSTKRVTKKPKQKEYVHPEQTVDELLEDTGADWPQVAMGVARELRMQGHPCGHLESQICDCEEWSKQPAEVELRIVEGLIEYLGNDLPVLSESASVAYEIFLSQPKHKGLTGPKLLEIMDEKGFPSDQSTLTSAALFRR